jgi:hypothetical protein
MDAWRFKEAHATMRIAESLGPKIAAAVAAADSLTAEQSGQVAKLQRRYEGATTRKGLRRLRADVHSLSIPASDPGLTTTGDDAFTDG